MNCAKVLYEILILQSMPINKSSKLHLILAFNNEILILTILTVSFFLLMNLFNHQLNEKIWEYLLLIFTLGKIYLIIPKTLKKLDVLMKNNHDFNHVLLVLGTVISVIIISFSIDYLCISEINSNAFAGLNSEEKLHVRFFNFLYYSIVTFSGVGYGDIYPKSTISKLITILEIISSFVMIVFIISKYFRKKEEKKLTI